MIIFENAIDIKNNEGLPSGQTVKLFITNEFHHYPLQNESIISVIAFKDLEHKNQFGMNAYSYKKSIAFQQTDQLDEPKTIQEAEQRILTLEEYSGGTYIE
jgi:hypothetical protein